MFLWAALAAIVLLAVNVIFIKYFYWGPGGKPPSPEDERRQKAQAPPTTRPKW